jgi:hypothetical protein
VITSSYTHVHGGGCASIVNGSQVRVAGTRQAEGSIQALEVDVETKVK